MLGFIETNDDANPHDAAIRFAMHLIDRVVSKLGEKVALPYFSQLLLEMVKTNDWRYKYAALMGLSQAGEYISDLKEMDHIVQFTLNFLKDEHPKVRYAALQTIGQFGDDSKPDFQIRYTDKVLPALIEIFNDPIPRVISHTLAALTNFLDGCARGSVSKYIPKILEPCFVFLENGISLVKEGAMSTVATLAEAGQADFIPYWEKSAQIVFTILKNTDDKAYKQVRGQAIECLVLIGESVGKEEFKKGAHDIIEKLVDIQKNYIEEVDPQKIYLLTGWQRICSVLKEDFLPYLEHILPSLFGLIERIIHYQVKESQGKSSDTADVLNALGGGAKSQNLHHQANTSESQETTLALRMINVFVVELSQGFLPHVERASNILTHLMQRSSNVNVQTTAGKVLPGLIKVIQDSNTPNKVEMVRAMSNNYSNLLWTTLGNESDAQTRVIYAMTLREVLRASGTYMSQEEVNLFSDNVLRALKKSDETKASNQELIEDDENEIEEDEIEIIEEENEYEEELHCALAEVIGALFETHRDKSVPLAQIVYTKILPNVLKDDMPSKIYKFGIFLVDNLIEYLGYDMMHNEWATLSDVLLKYTADANAEVRYSAAYGIGILARETKENFQSLAENCLKTLIAALQIKRGENEDLSSFGIARDNVVAAIGKIIRYQDKHVNARQLTQIWFKLLPLKFDKKEAREQHEMLMDIILQSEPALIFGDKGENLPAALRIFSIVANTKFASAEFTVKMQRIVRGLMENPDTSSLLKDAYEKLEPNLKEKLTKIVG